MLTVERIIYLAFHSNERVPWDNERVPDYRFTEKSLGEYSVHSDNRCVDISEEMEQLKK